MSLVVPNLVLRGGVHIASMGRRPRLSILIYHRVLAKDDGFNTWDVCAATFDSQVQMVARHFQPMPLSEAAERLRRGSLPPRSICLTFDDGYADNVDVALPILIRHKVPATFFIATGYLDGGRMWNDKVIDAVRVMPGNVLDVESLGLGQLELATLVARREAISRILEALKYLPGPEREARADSLAERAGMHVANQPMMCEAQVRELHRSDMEIGAHSVRHPILTRVSAAEARCEIVESGRRLAEIVRAPVRLFAYPNGKPGKDYAIEHVRMVREAGYSAAVSTAWGAATARTDPFQLPRFTPWDRSPDRFALRLIQNLIRPSSPAAV